MSLWHLVPAGKTWLRQNKLDLPARQFFDACRAAQEKNHDAKVNAVIRTCDEQAQCILDAAGRAWNASVAIEIKEAAA
jgi:hypothetical protein